MKNRRINLIIGLFIFLGFTLLIVSFWQKSPNQIFAYDMINSPDIVSDDLILNRELGEIKSISNNVSKKEEDDYEETSIDEAKEIITFIPPAEKKKKIKFFAVNEHIVQEGESLWSIAKNYNTDINSIVAYNDLKKTGFLPVGKRIKVPNMTGVPYIIRRNDTLYGIAKRYDLSPKEIMTVNRIKDAKYLQIGQSIFLPGIKYSYATGTRKIVKKFVWPTVSKVVTSPYGYRIHPKYRRKIFHYGIDIRGSIGTKVFAARSGRVYFASWIRGYGRVIILKHSEGFETRYAHLSRTFVRIGQWVEQGQVIGHIGRTGRVTGPHLHFEVKKGNRNVNPINYVSR